MMRIYFARSPSTGLIKIGMAWQPEIRLRDVERGMELLATTPGEKFEEQQFHAHFEQLQTTGEWFRPDPRLLDTIAAIADGTFDPTELPNPGWAITKPWQCKRSIERYGKLPGRMTFLEWRAQSPRGYGNPYHAIGRRSAA